STDAGVTWSSNVAGSPAFNPFLGYPAQNKMGDYMTIVSDNTGGDVAYTATFNLEEDIYHVRVAPPIAPIPTPTPMVSISGTIRYCSNPVPGPVPNVMINLTGGATALTMTDGSGHYTLASVASGG